MKSRDFLLIVLLIILDQITKLYFFNKNLILNNYFSFTSVKNTGVSFGLFQSSNLIFIFISLFIISLVVYYYKKNKKYSLAFAFILAGAIGNLIDRIFRGYVVDFIHFIFWYVFNLADLFICVGVLLLIYYTVKEKA